MDNANLPSPDGAVDAEGGQAITPDGETPEVELTKEVQGDEDIMHVKEAPAKKRLQFSFASWGRKAPDSRPVVPTRSEGPGTTLAVGDIGVFIVDSHV